MNRPTAEELAKLLEDIEDGTFENYADLFKCRQLFAEIDALTAQVQSLTEQLSQKTTDLQFAKDDLCRLDGACWHCLNPEIEDAWRHDHNSDSRFHWHHRLDPGDGLVSNCEHSEMYERIWQEAVAESRQQLAELTIERDTLKAKLEKMERMDGK